MDENVTAGFQENITGDCYPIFYDDFKCDVIIGFRRAVGVLSMLCCIFIVFIIVLFKKYRFLNQRLILYLAISAFFQAIGYVMGDYRIAGRARNYGEDIGACIFQGYWVLFFDWLSFIWVLCITFNIFWNAVFLKTNRKFEIAYIIIDIAAPIIICCFPFIGDSYGPAGLWCWISSVRDGEVFEIGVTLQFVLFYGPLWTLSIAMAAVLIFVVCVVHRRKKKFAGKFDPTIEAQKNLWEEEVRPLMLFPFLYIAILIFPCINRLRLAGGFSDPDSGANFFFWFMHSITLTLHGTVYALVFACDKQTLTRIKWSNMKAALVQRFKKPTKEYPLEANNRRETLGAKETYKPKKGVVNQTFLDSAEPYALYDNGKDE